MISAVATLGAGAISSAGQYYANQKNLDYTKWKNNVDYAIAERNNATQINLANSAHQREVADLRAAGLNPILSAGGSGAATPQLRSAEMGTFQTDNPVSSLGMSAKEAAAMHSAQVRATVDNLRAQNSNIVSQNKVLEEQARQEKWKADHMTKFSQTQAELEAAANAAKKVTEKYSQPRGSVAASSIVPPAAKRDSRGKLSNPDLFKAELNLENSARSAHDGMFKPVRIEDVGGSLFKPVRIRDLQSRKHSAIFTR